MLPDESTTRGDTAAAPGQLDGLVAAPGRIAARPLVDFLRAERLNLQLVTDAETAFEEALLHPPDVLLIDGAMGPAGGVELVQRLKANLRTHFIPVALWLHADDRTERVRAWAAGADAIFRSDQDAQERRTRLWALLRTHTLYRRQARRLQEQGVAMTTRRRWVDGFVHDVQSSMAAMQANFEFLLTHRGEEGGPRTSDEAKDPDLEECVRDMRSLFVEMKRGLRSVLDYERWESGRLELARQRVALAAVLEPLLGDLNGVAAVLGKRLRADATRAARAELDADPRLLGTALFNLGAYLLRKAVNGEVTVQVEMDEEEVRFVHSAPAEGDVELGSLFEPYARPHDQAPVGHGVGLALARAVAELHGGSVTAKRAQASHDDSARLVLALALPRRASPRGACT